MRRSVAWVLASAAVYAVVRYHGFKGLPWSDLPAYTANKILALAATGLLGVALWRRWRGETRGALRDLHAAGALAATHVLLSLVLLTPAYFAGFFSDGRLTAAAGLAMTAGAAAAAIVAASARARREVRGGGAAWRLAAVAALVALHAGAMGFDGWLAPGKWPGGMPPITLISAALGAAGAALALRRG